MGDIGQALMDGRWHMQRFYKAAATSGDGQWQDWSFAAGQPAYDARVGVAGEFNPFVATGNKAIWFPGINSDEHRHLGGITLRTLASGTNQVTLDAVVYDLLGTYPLLDGDSSDPQELSNDSPLPRYTDGKGVLPVLVNHVAPMLNAGAGTYTYIDSEGVEHTNTFGVALTGQNKIVSSTSPTGASTGPLSIPYQGGGVRSVSSLTFTTVPGGLYSLYLVRPLVTMTNNDGLAVAEKAASERCLCMDNGFAFPRIYDGAWLGFFLRPNGGSRSISSVFGNLMFIWG